MRTTKLLNHFLLKSIKLCHSIGAIAEEADTDALPIAATHGEAVASRDEVLAVGAIIELMAILLAIVCNSEVDRGWVFWIDSNVRVNNLALAVGFDEDALRTDADASEQLARTEEA